MVCRLALADADLALLTETSDGTKSFAPDLAYRRLSIVNVVFYGRQASYRPADPLVGGGVMALLSPLFPRSPFDLDSRLRPLPADQTIPGMPGWTWLHAPGHAPGHVSLWREADRSLIAGGTRPMAPLAPWTAADIPSGKPCRRSLPG